MCPSFSPVPFHFHACATSPVVDFSVGECCIPVHIPFVAPGVEVAIHPSCLCNVVKEVYS